MRLPTAHLDQVVLRTTSRREAQWSILLRRPPSKCHSALPSLLGLIFPTSGCATTQGRLGLNWGCYAACA